MSAPEVSVLLPVRDAAPTLGAALRSLERQTFRDFECVIADDGSIDESRAVANETARRDARFFVLELPRRDIVATLNDGLAACRGRFVARMDGDDLSHRWRLAAQLETIRSEPNLAAVGCHVRTFPRERASTGRLRYERWLNSLVNASDVRRDRYVECPIAHPTLLCRRDVLTRYAYRDTAWPEDYDLILRLLESGENIGMTPRTLLLWRDGAARLSRTHPRYAEGTFVVCKADFLARSFLCADSAYVLWGYGDTGRNLSRALAVHDKRPSHIVELHPGRIGMRIFGAPVIAPAGLLELKEQRPKIAVSVSGSEARGLIRGWLSEHGFAEGEDYVCAA